MRRPGWISIALALALAGLVIVPVCAFIVGYLLAGPYEGENGVLGYLGTIYAGLAAGQPSAVVLVSSPAIAVLAWFIAVRVRALLTHGTGTGD